MANPGKTRSQDPTSLQLQMQFDLHLPNTQKV